ncbi:hypothetical protein ACRRTK_007850 [Alexandromys fortis]
MPPRIPGQMHHEHRRLFSKAEPAQAGSASSREATLKTPTQRTGSQLVFSFVLRQILAFLMLEKFGN